MKTLKALLSVAAIGAAAILTGCGGGGGSSGGGSGSILYYPYETVYGDVCYTLQPTPGCTFLRSNGQRIEVEEDPDYNYWGNGTLDMWSVQFNASGTTGFVYDEFGVFQYSADVSAFDGWVGSYYIGVGITGLFWEDIRSGTYWLGRNGVLYSANFFDSNYGEAINNETASEAADTNFAALNSEANKQLVDAGAKKLQKEYGFKADKAKAVASALNTWAVAATERGFTTTKDMDKTFKSVFGVEYNKALAAVKDLQIGETAKMQDLTNRSAAALGLQPHMAQKFVKGMYKKALASWGYDIDQIQW